MNKKMGKEILNKKNKYSKKDKDRYSISDTVLFEKSDKFFHVPPLFKFYDFPDMFVIIICFIEIYTSAHFIAILVVSIPNRFINF